MQHAMPTPTSGSFSQGHHMGNPTSYVQTREHAFKNVSSAHQQPESQGTGVFLPQPQRPLHSSSRSQAKTLFKSKAAPVTPCGSILLHTASDLSCQSSATDFCLSASESCSTVPDCDSGALHLIDFCKSSNVKCFIQLCPWLCLCFCWLSSKAVF